jgi:hypothetical protein
MFTWDWFRQSKPFQFSFELAANLCERGPILVKQNFKIVWSLLRNYKGMFMKKFPKQRFFFVTWEIVWAQITCWRKRYLLLHVDTSSLRLFSEALCRWQIIRFFSVKHSWQCLVVFDLDQALDRIFHFILYCNVKKLRYQEGFWTTTRKTSNYVLALQYFPIKVYISWKLNKHSFFTPNCKDFVYF